MLCDIMNMKHDKKTSRERKIIQKKEQGLGLLHYLWNQVYNNA